MKPLLYFHIGGGKTGSSAIQAFLNINRDILNRKGIYYPYPEIIDFSDKINHSTIFVKLLELEKEKRSEYANFLVDSLYKYCIKYNITKTIISHEGMSPNNEFIRKIFSSNLFEIKVIVYIRRQDSWIESGWKQWGIKHKDCNDITDWIELLKTHPFWSQQLNWNLFISQWENLLRRKHIIVRIYEKDKLYRKNIIDDFMNILSISDIKDFKQPNRTSSKEANRGYNNQVLELIHISKNLMQNEHDNSFFEFLDQYLDKKYLKKPFDDYSILTIDQRLNILDYYKNSNNEILKKYFPDNDKLFSEEISNKSPIEVDTKEILAIMTEIMFKQYKELNMLKKKLNAKTIVKTNIFKKIFQRI